MTRCRRSEWPSQPATAEAADSKGHGHVSRGILTTATVLFPSRIANTPTFSRPHSGTLGDLQRHMDDIPGLACGSFLRQQVARPMTPRRFSGTATGRASSWTASSWRSRWAAQIAGGDRGGLRNP